MLRIVDRLQVVVVAGLVVLIAVVWWRGGFEGPWGKLNVDAARAAAAQWTGECFADREWGITRWVGDEKQWEDGMATFTFSVEFYDGHRGPKAVGYKCFYRGGRVVEVARIWASDYFQGQTVAAK